MLFSMDFSFLIHQYVFSFCINLYCKEDMNQTPFEAIIICVANARSIMFGL